MCKFTLQLNQSYYLGAETFARSKNREIIDKHFSPKSKTLHLQGKKTFTNGNNFLFSVKQKFTNTKKSTSEA